MKVLTALEIKYFLITSKTLGPAELIIPVVFCLSSVLIEYIDV